MARWWAMAVGSIANAGCSPMKAPLCPRRRAISSAPAEPRHEIGGKRPRVTLSPTLVTQGDGHPYLALSTPGGDNQDQALIQVLLDVLDFNLNAQNAVEAPRFQTRHLVSSFDNHAWNRGDLLLDERIPPATYTDLTERGHQTSSRSRYANGAAPVAIKVLPSGVIEAGADPFYNRSAHAW